MFDSWEDHELMSANGNPGGVAVAQVAQAGHPTRHAPLPTGLAEMPPGAELGAALASIDRSRLSQYDQVTVLKAWNRQVAHSQAELHLSMVAVSGAEADTIDPAGDFCEIFDLAASEIQAALVWTRRASEFHLSFSQYLVEHPQVLAALHRGQIDLPKARVIIEQTGHLDRDKARQVADIVLRRAGSQTTGQLRARLHRLDIAADPD